VDTDRPRYLQTMGQDVVAAVSGSRHGGVLYVENHFWPGWATPKGPLVAESAAREILDAADEDGRGRPLDRGIRTTAASQAGPIQLHLCWRHRTGGPCVDVVTGVVLRGGVSQTVESGNTTRH